MKNFVRFDWAIKRLLRNKANFGILEGFLSELLHQDIKIDSILERESNKETAENKLNRVDMLVRNSKGELIIIEVQSDYMQDYLLRMLYSSSKLIVDNLDAGMLYGQIKKVISVNLVYFDLGHGEDFIYRGRTKYKGIYKKDRLLLSSNERKVYGTKHIAHIYPEYYIIKINNFNDVAKNELDEWINFLKNEEVKDGTKAKGLKEAKEKLDILKLNKEDKIEYDAFVDNWRKSESAIESKYIAGKMEGLNEGIEIGKSEGIQIGKSEGIELGKSEGIQIGEANKEKYAAEQVKREKLETAAKCLKKGMAIGDIAEFTGLTEQETGDINF